MPRLKGLDHVGLKVTDMDETVGFYQRLGLTLLRMSGPDADGERSAVMQVGSQELNIFSHPQLGSADKGGSAGMDHLCFIADAESVDELIADLRQVGIDVVKGPHERRDGTALFVHDPDGVRVELQLKRATTRAGHQPQGRQGPRPDEPAVADGAGG